MQYYRTLSGPDLTPEEKAAADADYQRGLDQWEEAQKRGFEGVVGQAVESNARRILEHFGTIEPSPEIGPPAPYDGPGGAGWTLRPLEAYRIKTEADAMMVNYARRILDSLRTTRFWYRAVKGGSELVGSLVYYAYRLGWVVGQADFAAQWGKSLLPVISARERAADKKKAAREQHIDREHLMAARLWMDDPALTKSDVARRIKSRMPGSRTVKRILADLPTRERLLRGFPCVSKAGTPRREHEWDGDDRCLFCEAVKAGPESAGDL